MLRVPDAGRVEHRGVDGSANHAKVKHAEFDAYHATVSEWEIDRHRTLV
jgi:glutamine synthetase